MATSYASRVLSAGADQVWDYVRDFNNTPEWLPISSESDIEDGKRSDQVGCVRRVVLGNGAVVRERLVAMHDGQRWAQYDLLDSPFPVRSYRATLHVHPVTANGSTFIEWTGTFDCDATDTATYEALFSDDVYEAGLAELEKRFAGE